MAAENGALPNGKVGGLGDVIRDLPAALCQLGIRTSVMIPAYGVYGSLPGARRCAEIRVAFAGTEEAVGVFELPESEAGVGQLVLDHPRFAPRGPGRIYTDDPSEGPFATDATKFAFYCAAAAAALNEGVVPMPGILHLHDWQAALVLLLRRWSPASAALKKLRTVFTIHNIAMQGVRPLRGYDSSLESWFPELVYDEALVCDPRWTDCVNPMAIGIRLADAVNTVSPTYAREILEPSDATRGYSGGEGLESDLRKAEAGGRLSGILNGCRYPAEPRDTPDWRAVLDTMRSALASWIASEPSLRTAHYLADKRLAKLTVTRPDVLLTSIGRITAQKVQLFSEPTRSGAGALEQILDELGPQGLFVMVGSGEAELEAHLRAVAARREGFVFLNGYSDALAEQLYSGGDLFLMPSSFEPCGISQMLAMRAGQLCVVHGVGGLKDTVTDEVDGFAFGGETPTAQADAFVERVRQALQLRRASMGRWQRMQQAAEAARFSWADAAALYEKRLYGLDRVK